MSTQRNRMRIGVGAGVLVIVLGLSLLAFAGNPPANRTPARALGAAESPRPALAGRQTAIYVQFDGMPGESMDKEHMGWCNALSFSQEQMLPDAGSAAGSGSGRPILKDVVVTKVIDKASPKIAQSVWQGLHHKQVRIDVACALPTGTQTCYSYELSDVMITGCHVTGTAGAQGLPIEEISLSFREIKTTYTEYGSKGEPRGNVTCSYKKM